MFVKYGLLQMVEAKRAKWNTFTLRLCKNFVLVTLDTLAAAFTECDYTGYAPQAITGFGPAVWDVAAVKARSEDTPHTFRPTGTAVPNTVFGSYVTDGAGLLIAARMLDAPFEMNGVDKVLFLTPQVTDADLG